MDNPAAKAEPTSSAASATSIDLDTANVTNAPPRSWFTCLPGTSPVAFATGLPPDFGVPTQLALDGALCLHRNLPRGPPRTSGTFSGERMLVNVPIELLDQRLI